MAADVFSAIAFLLIALGLNKSAAHSIFSHQSSASLKAATRRKAICRSCLMLASLSG